MLQCYKEGGQDDTVAYKESRTGVDCSINLCTTKLSPIISPQLILFVPAEIDVGTKNENLTWGVVSDINRRFCVCIWLYMIKIYQDLFLEKLTYARNNAAYVSF